MSVTEPLPFTSVPKFITIYLLSRQFLHVVVVYSSCCSPATYRIEFNDNFFKNNIANETLIVGFCSLSWDSHGFYEKVRFLWRDALRLTVSIILVNVLQICFYLTVEILSHQQSPSVVYRGFFVTKFKIREIDHIL